MTPDAFRRMTIREVVITLRAQSDLDDDAWRVAANVIATLINTSSSSTAPIVQPRDVFPGLWNPSAGAVDWDERERAAIEREEAYMRQWQQAEDRRRREGDHNG